jgi:predicted transcriptional regulator
MMEQTLRDEREIFRDEMFMKDRIMALLKNKAMTIPELASSLGCPSNEVLAWIAALMRFGLVEAQGKANEEGYFLYTIKG